MFSEFEIYIDYLMKVKIFEGLTAYQIEKFLDSTNYNIKEFNVNDEIPEDIHRLIFVLSGSTASYSNLENGKKSFVTIFEPKINNLIIINKSIKFPYDSLRLISRKKSIVLFIDIEIFNKQMVEVTSIQNQVLMNAIKIYDRLVEFATEKSIVNTSGVSSERLKNYLKLLYSKKADSVLTIPYKKSEFADYLNLDISTVSREIKKLCELGLIEVRGKYIKISNLKEFEDYILS